MGKEIREQIVEECTKYTGEGWVDGISGLSAFCGHCKNKLTVKPDGKIEIEGCLGHRLDCLQSAVALVLRKSKI